ncbi:MAG: hypothetical protein EZS28_033179 [Streblomastix strix]|uniref:NrS-1 polymerase-like helicase domain-containing protein n=1 Tax=Streblomastix strix TaxID=222440 RepID=A0A5J4UND5_9EUKA|nr:MAG: hypothetical protein EZS28_033179 [Streblomastix strix]
MLENKVFLVLNELKTFSNAVDHEVDKLKSLITDPTLEIRTKFLNSHIAKNLLNFVLVSNHLDPVHLDQSDRRYLVCQCNSKYRKNFEYFNKLFQHINQVGFYENLLTFFMNRDISKFDKRIIPLTEAKMEIIEISLADIDRFRITYFKQLKDGWLCEDAVLCSQQFMKPGIFRLQIQKNYETVIKSNHGKKLRYYVMKQDKLEELQKYFQQQDPDYSQVINVNEDD